TFKLEAQILDLVNITPYKSSVRNQQLIMGRVKSVLTMRDIINLFLYRDTAQYLDRTLLTGPEINKVQQLTFEFLLHATKMQHCELLLELIDNVSNTNNDTFLLEQRLIELGSALNVDRAYDPRQHFGLLVFEYRERKMIRPEQMRYMDALTTKVNGKYSNELFKIVMGGGKSKLFLPYLGFLKADGKRLSVLVVPHELYNTNFQDLFEVASSVFDQKVLRFDFDRNKQLLTGYFESLYYSWLDAIKRRHYILSTPEAIQSLLLKFMEYIFDKTVDSNPDVHFLAKILHLLHTKADITIDEADQIFNVKAELNYCIGQKYNIMEVYPNVAQDLLQLFYLLETKFVISAYIKEDKVLTPSIYAALRNALVDALFTDAKHVLQNILANQLATFSLLQQGELKNYLINPACKLPDFLANSNKSIKDRLAVLRQNLSTLLETTLAKHLNEEYGVRADSNGIAIPYRGANYPSERAEFSSFIETINYTAQYHLATDISFDLFKATLKHFESKYLRQRAAEAEPQFIRNECAKLQQEFAAITGLNVQLNSINTDAEDTLHTLHDSCKSRTVLKFYILEHIVLRNYKISALSLSSNAQTLARMLNTCQAFSGTIANHRTMTTLKARTELSIGLEGQVASYIYKNTAKVHFVANTNLPNVFAQVTANTNISAIIDQAAYFKNYPNESVARKLVEALGNESNIKHVLFFDQNNKLCAISNTSNVERKYLASSDLQYLQRELKCTPKQWFVFYDQQHTFGVDLPLPHDATALLTIKQGVNWRDLQQAAMRMRNLSVAQKLEFIVPNELKSQLPDVRAIVEYSKQNLLADLAQEHFVAAKRQIDATIAATIRNLLVDTMIEKTQIKEINHNTILAIFEEFIFSSCNSDLFVSYGQPKNLVSAANLLAEYANMQVANFEACSQHLRLQSKPLQAFITTFIKREIARIRTECNDIVASLAPLSPNQVFSCFDNSGSEQIAEVEIEQEAQAEIETNDDSWRTHGNRCRNWLNADSGFDLNSPSAQQSMIKLKAVFKDLATYDATFGFADINVMINLFRINKRNIKNYLPDFSTIAICIDHKENIRNYFIFSASDCMDLPTRLNDKTRMPTEHQQFIIITLRGDIMFNSKPDMPFVATAEHHRVMEQMAFLNGDFDLVMQRPEWILQNTAAKITFFKEYRLPGFPNKRQHFNAFLNRFATNDANRNAPMLEAFLNARTKAFSPKRDLLNMDRSSANDAVQNPAEKKRTRLASPATSSSSS
ncbi:MAG TPA: DUF3638 domain-containing protein, partial [Gammaproteobacteria bacterium]|nr:DUF3638 domain-containing protein [Gammaproteobacteria bacterium]